MIFLFFSPLLYTSSVTVYMGRLTLLMISRLFIKKKKKKKKKRPAEIEELISFFLHSLYSWTAAYLAPLVISYNDFLVLFSSSS
jgi:hypothetical protein